MSEPTHCCCECCEEHEYTRFEPFIYWHDEIGFPDMDMNEITLYEYRKRNIEQSNSFMLETLYLDDLEKLNVNYIQCLVRCIELDDFHLSSISLDTTSTDILTRFTRIIFNFYKITYPNYDKIKYADYDSTLFRIKEIN